MLNVISMMKANTRMMEKEGSLFFMYLSQPFLGTAFIFQMVQTAGRTRFGEFAPKFAELNDDVLFGEVWSHTDKLGLRDRSLVTITSLISQGITDNSLVFHLQSAKKNDITRTKIAEIITHTGFYAGWPKAWAAFNLAKGVWAEDMTGKDAKVAFQREMIFPVGEPNTAYAQYFIGNSYLASVSREQVNISNVTFEPRCRNNWHIHKATKDGGQMLIGEPDESSMSMR